MILYKLQIFITRNYRAKRMCKRKMTLFARLASCIPVPQVPESMFVDYALVSSLSDTSDLLFRDLSLSVSDRPFSSVDPSTVYDTRSLYCHNSLVLPCIPT